MLKHRMIIIISVIAVALPFIAAIENCDTPNDLPGHCIMMKDCPVLLAKHNANKGDKFLKKSKCGRRTDSLFMCCPLDIKTTTSSIDRDDNTIPEPTDISSIKNHRNIGLINSKKCGPDITNRMYTGNKTSLYQYKWNVLLQFESITRNERVKFMCEGSLIADQYVLSAASCTNNAKKEGYELVSVRLGEHDQSTEKDCIDNEECAPPIQDIKVESYKFHEMYYDELSVNDIMMIKLEHPVEYTRNIKTICLPTNENELIRNTVDIDQLTITGWGNKEQNSYSDILLFTQMHFVPLKKCMKRLKKSGILTKLYQSQICAKVADSMDACIGESGGPLVGGTETINEHGIAKIKNFQFGIVSIKTGCRLRGALPEVYTSVAYYMEWILNQMDH